MDSILIEGLEVDAIIGVHEHERNNRQPVVIDLELSVDITAAAQSDNLGDTVSYGDIARAVTALVEESRYQLVETLAERIATMVLADFDVEGVRVKVAKPAAVPNARTVAVSIERSA